MSLPARTAAKACRTCHESSVAMVTASISLRSSSSRKSLYTTARLVYPHWFHISDYSLGYVSGWGIHHIDIAQWGNGTELTGPVEIEGSARFPDDDALCDNPLSCNTR